jgi:hypothetical protein
MVDVAVKGRRGGAGRVISECGGEAEQAEWCCLGSHGVDAGATGLHIGVITGRGPWPGLQVGREEA